MPSDDACEIEAFPDLHSMRGRQTLICLLFLVLPQVSAAAQSNGYGPEIKSFLEFMRHEEDELEFQIRHNEIPRREYLKSKARIIIHRQTILNLASETGEDRVPELHIVTLQEVDQLIEDGASLVKNLKRGDVIKEKWRYVGSAHRGETFYIFERLTTK